MKSIKLRIGTFAEGKKQGKILILKYENEVGKVFSLRLFNKKFLAITILK